MNANLQKEEFQYACVSALAAHAGLNRGDFRVDDDSVDVSFKGLGYHGAGRRRNPIIEFQLKCTSQDLINGEVIKFSLKRKNYDDLRGDDVMVPKYLVVMLVPVDKANWITVHRDLLHLPNSCYWLSLRDYPPTNNPEKIVVEVPLANRVTPETLIAMMEAASLGEAL
ncbi:DUF4365 domain-containing protein [Azoarcus sp. DN11]|uniref:DUF4365 domain-containing protein n=1 Tax=Azoarcus sp. DN11 TaxID=356837 RepID=UPI000EB43859|nr:DUF4365 domain-containing protein [Azoarcus sp. DN11]AYH45104.1 hypothetical protein CDA09_17255 [Azoarcus sp. DN11]